MENYNIDLIDEFKEWVSEKIWDENGNPVTRYEMNFDDEYTIL